MGIFSSIWKGIKGVFKGIVKVFSPILKPIAKFLGSDFGKALMMALSVFTLGASLIAGVQGFGAGTGFIGKFVNGGKEFLNTLLGTSFKTVGNQAGGAGAVVGTGGIPGDVPGMITEGGAVGGGTKQMAGEMLTGQGAGGGLIPQKIPIGTEAVSKAATSPGGITGNLLGGAPTAAAGAAKTTQQGGWLSRAAGAAMDFAKTPSGGTIIGSMISGIGEGMRQKNEQEFESRVERMFADPNDPGMQALRSHDFSINAPQGMSNRVGSNFASTLDTIRARRTNPSIPFRRTQPAGGT